MKKIFLLLILIISNLSASAQFTVTGDPKEYTDDLSGTGIEKVYVFKTLAGNTISYKSKAISVKFYTYQHSLSDRVQIPDSNIEEYSNAGETIYTIRNLTDSRGYLVEENGNIKRTIWIIDYNQHQPVLTSIQPVDNGNKLTIEINKSDELPFYSIQGVKIDIKRKYTLSYNTLEWNDDNKTFEQKTITIADIVGNQVILEQNNKDRPIPIADTRFTLSGDQFAESFNLPKTIESDLYQATSVIANIVTEQENEGKAENEKDPEGGTNSFNAPVTVNFYSNASDAVVYFDWNIYLNDDMQNPIARFTDRDIRYTFTKQGKYTIVLDVSDATSSNTKQYSTTFDLSDSFLDIPNYFSPGTSPGSNDEFRVAYRSLIKFKCTIFNRWGVKLYEWTDPAKGWDGKYKGKYVNTGVYYYVIIAEGSDGKKYKKGGDINILRSK